MVRRIRILACEVIVVLCLPASTAFSQQAAFDSDVVASTVQNRERPEYDPVGGRIGTYFFYPTVESGLVFDDNILSRNTNKKSSLVQETKGRLFVRSDMPRHKLDFEFGVDNYVYFGHHNENHIDFYGGSIWRFDIDRSFNIAGTAYAARLHEARGSAEAPGTADEPVPYTKLDATFSLNKSFNRMIVALGSAVQNLDYNDVSAVGGGKVDQDNRDGTVYTAVGRASYEFSPGYRAFINIEGNRRNFKNNRDSTGIEVRGGVAFEISRLVLGELSAGYLHQNYKTAGLTDVKSPAFRASILWNPTSLITVDLAAERRVSETTVVGASGRLDSIFSASLDYEVLRNVIVTPHASYQIGNYKGVSRNDKTLSAGVSGQYLINRYLAAKAFYEFTSRNSNVGGQDYKKNRIGGSIKVQF